VAIVHGTVGGANASAIYLVAVVAMAAGFGTWPAVATAVAALLVDDFLFTQPLYAFAVATPAEVINLLLFLLVGTVVGRLTAQQAERAADADRRARESAALFSISRILATAATVEAAAPAVLDRLARETGMTRIWFATRATAGERTVVDSAPDRPRPAVRVHWLLTRTPGDQPARWVRAHEPKQVTQAAPGDEALFRVRVEADGASIGSLWAVRDAAAPIPGREETRLLALAADQLGIALHRDRLAGVAMAAEVARQGDALKTALLASVSHGLRTPLASIRAAAGSLMDPAVPRTASDIRDAARAIDAEAERLNRLVANLLDLSRIEAGALRPTLEVLDVGAIVEPVVSRVGRLFVAGRVDVELPDELPPVRADAMYVDEAITNLLENAARHAGGAAHVRVSGTTGDAGLVTLTVEDDGPGVSEEAMPQLFEKFSRVGSASPDGHAGMGIGMSVVKGLVEAMGGRVSARRSALGGLAVDVELPVAAVPVSIGA
jgi:two-component system sensor histidine kinase KdpD